MKIQKYNWETMQMEDVEVADRPMIEFLNWILHTQIWMQDPEILFNRVVHLKRQIAEQTPTPVAVEPALKRQSKKAPRAEK